MNKGTKGISLADQRLAVRPYASAPGFAVSRQARQELRPFLEATAAAGRGRGLRVTGVAEAGERPFPGATGRFRAAAVLHPNRAQGVGG